MVCLTKTTLKVKYPKYVNDSLVGVGAIKGSPCEIQSITPIDGGNRITYAWIDTENVTHTDTLDVMDGDEGASVESAVEEAVEDVVGSWTVLKSASTALETDMTGYKEALVYATNSYGTSTSNWHIVLDAYSSQVQFNGIQNDDSVIWNPVTKKLNVASANANCTVIAR